MNIEIILQGLGGQMLEKANRYVGKIHVCWYCNELRAHASNHTEAPHPVFYIADAKEIKKGLNAAQWNILRTKILNFLSEKQ